MVASLPKEAPRPIEQCRFQSPWGCGRRKWNPPVSKELELIQLLSKVVADLAPFAISQGYEISFDTDICKVSIEGDDEALDRANLLRNAI